VFTLHGIAIDISLATLEERHSFTNVLAVSRIIYSLSPVFLIRSNAVETFTQIANISPVQAATLDVEGTYLLNPNINDISSFTSISTTFPSACAFAPGLPDNAADAYIHELQLFGILLALSTDWE
jgi:hypothetical protein